MGSDVRGAVAEHGVSSAGQAGGAQESHRVFGTDESRFGVAVGGEVGRIEPTIHRCLGRSVRQVVKNPSNNSTADSNGAENLIVGPALCSRLELVRIFLLDKGN